MENLRQVRYNMKTEIGDQVSLRHRWIFVIVNQLREIDRIEQKVLNELAPVDDLTLMAENPIRNSGGLHYHAFAISSDRGTIKKPGIYNGKFVKDRDLAERKNPLKWFENVYIPRIIQ